MRRLISLYTGAGGLDLGFEAAGFTTSVAVEMDPEAVATLRHNRGWPVLDRDVHTISSRELLDTAGLAVGEADALIGGPPCQPFSKSGYWASGDTLRLDDPRAGTLGAYLRVLHDTLPKTFLLENVPGLIYQRKSEGLQLIARTIGKINRECGTSYTLAVAKLNAADHGVPQIRERVFVVGAQDGTELSFPAPTHVQPDGLPLGRKPYATAWDAIGDLEDAANPELRIKGKWADLLPSIPEGENYLWHTERGGGVSLFGWRRRYWSFLLKLSKALPSWTIQAQPGPAIGPFHWKSRRLSARELCRLQTVPDDFAVLGNIASVQRQIGNAVPSALAEVLARSMRHQLLGDRISLDSQLIPAPRLPIPAPEPVRAVPFKYRHLIGDHEAHPGTGQGYSASRRKEQDLEPESDEEPKLAFA
ncbi:MAG: (cytosine-5)-methyltransferase 1 [Acidobacteriota bacterium]|jgi:DNA (cytosine-5)-methyltransferase 1|nr:(cytosine-5)-methyltransferase 1 [Acidobacteriota bacterium]